MKLSHIFRGLGRMYTATSWLEGTSYIFYGAVVLFQVSEIGDGAIIGARAVVTKDVLANTIVAGNPARVIREIKPNERDYHRR